MSLFSGLVGGAIRFPDAAINRSKGLLPMPIEAGVQFSTPDGRYGDSGSLLPGGLSNPYAYGVAARISTQTQMAHPNRVAMIIPKLYLPAPESDGLDHSDPVLEHSISDGDLGFTIVMHPGMKCYGSQYCVAPYGYAAKAVPIVNLPTINYILWGLQVGLKRRQSSRWKTFFTILTKGESPKYPENMDINFIWRFIQRYIKPIGIQHGSDTQGGQHEGDNNRVVTHGAVDYVTSFAIEGKILHVNNMWRDYDVHENDDLILALRRMETPHMDVQFNLSSSVRSHRSERTPISNGWFFLRPEVLEYRSFSEFPYIHIGRSQKYCSVYNRGTDACCWDARMAVVPGAPLQMTFQPMYVDSEKMYYAKRGLNGLNVSSYYGAPDSVSSLQMREIEEMSKTKKQNVMEGPPHLLKRKQQGSTGVSFSSTLSTVHHFSHDDPVSDYQSLMNGTNGDQGGDGTLLSGTATVTTTPSAMLGGNGIQQKPGKRIKKPSIFGGSLSSSADGTANVISSSAQTQQQPAAVDD